MTNVFEIPLNPYAEKFNIDINNVRYFFRTHWNQSLGQWTLDLGKSEDDCLICNLALVAGQDLLIQYDFLNLGFHLFVLTDGDEYADPTEQNLGEFSHLLVAVE